MRRGEGGKVYRFNAFEQLLRIQQADGIPCDQSAKRISNDADLLDLIPCFSKFFECFLDLAGDALPSSFDAVISEVTSVALRDEYVDFVLGVLFQESFAQRFKVLRIAPKPVGISQLLGHGGGKSRRGGALGWGGSGH